MTDAIKETKEVNESNEALEKGIKDSTPEQDALKESGSTGRKENSVKEDFDINKIYDTLKEKEAKLEELTATVEKLKQANTDLLLRISSNSAPQEDPLISFMKQFDNAR